MTKTMTLTLSVLTASLLAGLGGGAFAATSHEHQSSYAERRASRLDADPVDPPIRAALECSIDGAYLGRPYCFGSEGYGGQAARSERRAERLETRGAY